MTYTKAKMQGHYSKTKLNAKIIEKYNNKNKFRKQHNSGRHTISCPLTLKISPMHPSAALQTSDDLS